MGADIGDVSLPVDSDCDTDEHESARIRRSLNFAFQASNLAATTNNKIINITASPSANLSYTANGVGRFPDHGGKIGCRPRSNRAVGDDA